MTDAVLALEAIARVAALDRLGVERPAAECPRCGARLFRSEGRPVDCDAAACPATDVLDEAR